MKNILYLCALNFNSNMRTILDNQKEKIALIQQVLPESLTYEVYRKKILADLQLVSNEELNTPGSLPHYAHLNHARMNRLDKTIALDDHSIKILNNLKIKYVWILITEGWCGDAAQIAPVISKLADFSDHIDLKIVLRDQHLDLMDQFLTNGARAIPKLIILNESQISILFISCDSNERNIKKIFNRLNAGETSSASKYIWPEDHKNLYTFEQRFLNKNELLSIVNAKIEKDYMSFYNDPESRDCFDGASFMPYTIDQLGIEFSTYGIDFNVAFGLSGACMSVDGTKVSFNFDEIRKYLKE
jgi:thiol-disulfide isomerase/thioredoxin